MKRNVTWISSFLLPLPNTIFPQGIKTEKWCLEKWKNEKEEKKGKKTTSEK